MRMSRSTSRTEHEARSPKRAPEKPDRAFADLLGSRGSRDTSRFAHQAPSAQHPAEYTLSSERQPTDPSTQIEDVAPVAEVGLFDSMAQRTLLAAPSFVDAPVEVVAPDPVHDPIIQAVAVAIDSHRRKLLFLRVRVPGRGLVDVRLHRGMSGVELSLRADDPDLRRDLQLRRSDLAARARAADLGVSRIEISGA